MANRTRRTAKQSDLTGLYKSIDDSLGVEQTPVRILVLGPAFGKDAPGSKLRHYIVRKCRRQQFVVVIAEHNELQQYFLKLFDPIHDLCKMEWILATQQDKRTGYDLIDGIIILPDSPGSFVELGMFVFEANIHSKILVLFNKDHEPTIEDSFIGKGPKLAFDNGHARTIMMDYGDLRGSWTQVQRFLKFRKSSRLWQILRQRTLANAHT